MSNALDAFLPPVRKWFRESFSEPTPPQAQGWPPIQRGEHTLILAPTGSGKTLAAFLWGIDQIYRDLTPQSPRLKGEGEPQAGVRLLYVSPLKALNNDIERNLRLPLEGIRDAATRLKQPLPSLRVAVRTGDTPSHVRAQMWKRPPHILITTPESLYLMLTSPRAREMFRTVRTVIVDEVHTLVGDKRGAHLSLSLERLAQLTDAPVQRIGLSATIKPLDEVARFLGGQTCEVSKTPQVFTPRFVTIVDAGYRKPLDLQVVTAIEDFTALPAGTIWPHIIPRVLQDIREHRTTLIFTNNRRLAERTADRLNAQLAAEQSEEIPPGSPEALAPSGVPREGGMFAIGAEGPIRAHHGSMSREARREMEEELKSGKLPALVGTSSLELGIDIGAIDLVVQLQSPKSVAQGLQRVGRSGHLVGQTSVGRIYATFPEDLVEAAAVTRGMLEADVEPAYTPQNPLDVLAQQIVAMVAVEDWRVDELFDLVRRAYAYHDLSLKTLYLVLEMLTGKYQDMGAQQSSPLRAKIAWDRVHDRLTALPGSRLLAFSNAGTIADRGTYGVYLGDGKTKVGELDEEFVYETRAGNTFLLGSQVWRVLDIQNDRVIVGDAAGALPRMPFWRGDYPWRTYDLGVRIGKFRRELAEQIRASQGKLDLVADWLRREYRLDENSTQNLIAHLSAQLAASGVISSDRHIIVESFADAIGERYWVIHSPFGGRVNGAWALALSSALRERIGIDVETQTSDDGILFKFPQAGPKPSTDMVRQMSAAETREHILRELPNSALFGAHFRMNAARALLLPKAHGRKRTPFWLQRLKAKDLLALVRQFDDFPMLAETYRDCLRDVLDLPHLEEVLSRIHSGEIRVVPMETINPSPIAARLLFSFQQIYQYEWDTPKAERQLAALALRRDVLDDLLGAQSGELNALLKPAAIGQVGARAQHLEAGYQARSLEEFALYLYELGDLTIDEIIARCTGDGREWIAGLAAQDRAAEMELPTRQGVSKRWVHVEHAEEYREAFGPGQSALSPKLGEGSAAQNMLPLRDERRAGVLRRFFRNSGPLTRDAILNRYAFDERWLDSTLAQLVESRAIGAGHFTAGIEQEEFCDRNNLEQIYQRTLTLLRKEVQPVSQFAYADFLTRWQHLHPQEQLNGADGLRRVLQQLRGIVLPGVVWERDVLPARLADYEPGDLDALAQSGELIWVGSGREPRRSRIRFFFRGEGFLFRNAPEESEPSDNARAIYEFLQSEGASFAADIEVGVGLSRAAVSDALIELALAGLVTNDSIDAMRSLLQHEPSARRGISSALDSELAMRLHRPARITPARITPVRYRAAKRRVRERLNPGPQIVHWQGRWSLVQRSVVMGKALPNEARAEKLARVLLVRYGVVTRECLEHEELPVDWSALYPHLQRMEMRGEVRRGYFVAGLSGGQFALPDAVEKLRACATAQDAPSPALHPRQERGAGRLTGEEVVLNAADPANLTGAGSQTEPIQFARVPSTYLVLWRGQLVLIAEDNGRRINTLRATETSVSERALQAYLDRVNVPHHLVVTHWNDELVLGSAGEAMLKALGFDRTPSGMEKWM